MIENPAEITSSTGPDTARAVDFLMTIVPQGLVALAANIPDGFMGGRTFSIPEERDAMAAWIEVRQGRMNIYVTLNEPKPISAQKGGNGRLCEADIIGIRGIVVDVDPNPDEEKKTGGFEREQVRLLAKAREMETYFGGPTAIAHTGGGIQAWYVLPEALPVNETSKRAVRAQALGLARKYGGDCVQSLEHLFRVPFTINLPGKQKRARGRQKSVATLLSCPRNGRARLPLLTMQLLALPVHEGRRAAPADGFDGSEALAYLGEPDELPISLVERLTLAQERMPALRRCLDPSLAAERFSDRSSRDYAIAASLREAGNFAQAEAAQVVAAYSPDKVEERGETYLARTVNKAWANTEPLKRAEEYYETNPAANKPDAGASIEWIDPRTWEGQEPTKREWEVKALIPRGEVTLLYGAGGVGKTLLIHQYATAAATGHSWLGQQTRPARVLCFFCEDSAAEIHRRQCDINRSMGVAHSDLSGLKISARRGEDNYLATWGRNDIMVLQPIWHKLRGDALAFGADVILLDTLADIYCGSEIDRAMVSAFVKACLGRLAQETGTSIITLGHPSQSGEQTGRGMSGSTAWSNAARSRLYLRYPEGVSDGNIRELENMKSNYGPKGGSIKLRWSRGTLEPIASTMPGGEDALTSLPRTDDAAEHAVLKALALNPGERLSLTKNSPRFAPKVLKRVEPDILAAYTSTEVQSALDRLFKKKTIHNIEVGQDNSRRKIYGFAIAADKLSADEEQQPSPQPAEIRS